VSEQGDHDGFVRSYRAELEALRQEGEAFADRYPKIAGRLKLGDDANPDPHVERLVESFAFLAARVQRKLNDDYPELSDAMLELLYPQLTRPIPSMAIVELELDTKKSVPASGKEVPRGTRFLSRPVQGEPLTFVSTTAATLWPVRVADAVVSSPSPEDRQRHPRARAALVLRLETIGAHDFSGLRLERLRFFLKGESGVVSELYELWGADVASIDVAGTTLDASRLQPAGFSERETMLASPRRSFAGYGLLQEYFAFPQKFHFFELAGLEGVGLTGKSVEIRFVLQREPRVPEASIGADNFSLACVPLINLFAANADPISIQPLVSEYDIVPDRRHAMNYEVYSVEKVEAAGQRGAERSTYVPFFSLHGGAAPEAGRVYWQPRRRASRRKADDGTEVSIALVNLDLAGAPVDGGTLHVKILCTNRDVPFRSGKWGGDEDFRPEDVSGIAAVRCVHRPTRTLRPALRGAAHWRLVSQLSLNYLSLVSEGRAALREILRIHDIAESAATRREIEGVLEIRCEPAVRWMASRFGSGFVRGLRTTIKLDREGFVGSSLLLFATVIERFLALYCAINSFSELSLETAQDEGEVFRWPPRAGERVML